MKDPNKVAMGKKSREAGARFERKVRKELEEKGFIVDKWSNNIDLDSDIMIKAKVRFLNGRPFGIGVGFPDFVAFMPCNYSKRLMVQNYKVKWVECKTNNILSKTEKLKMNWMLKNHFEVWVAYNENKEIKYRKFVEYKERSKVCGKNTRN